MHTRNSEVHWWTAPDRQFCDAINAPATLVRMLLESIADQLLPGNYRIELIIETVIYLTLVWVVWYVLGVEITGGGTRALAAGSRMRRVVDICAIVFGSALAVTGLLVVSQFGSPTAYSTAVAVPYFIWATTMIIFYGYDLVAHCRPPSG
ncbi:MAG TPA: hypothetical protein VJX67_08800, partial [Blastocatellia bacterium]|nr:hypothetical protein [Blastocatellia bacterium]